MKKQYKRFSCATSSIKDATDTHNKSNNLSECVHDDDDNDDDDLTENVPVAVNFSALEFLPGNLQLKPKLDKIFADVEGNLPTINFDNSDLSSEEDVDIFNRALKSLGSKSGDTVYDLSDNEEVEKQIYEEHDQAPTKKKSVIPAIVSLTSGTKILLKELEQSASILYSRNKTFSCNIDESSPSVKPDSEKNMFFADSECSFAVRHDQRINLDLNSNEDRFQPRLSAVHKSKSIEQIIAENKTLRKKTTSLRKTSPLLHLSSQKMVELFLPDTMAQLDVQFNQIEGMLPDTVERRQSEMNHGDNEGIYSYNPPTLVGGLDETSLMDRLTKFAISSTDVNTNDKSTKDLISKTSAGVQVEFLSMGTNTKDLLPTSCKIETIAKKSNEETPLVIDLRPANDVKQKEDMLRMQRVLDFRCNTTQNTTPSGDDSDDDDKSSDHGTELWFEHRRRIKESLRLGKPILPEQPSKPKSACLSPLPKYSAKPQRLAGHLPKKKSQLKKKYESFQEEDDLHFVSEGNDDTSVASNHLNTEAQISNVVVVTTLVDVDVIQKGDSVAVVTTKRSNDVKSSKKTRKKNAQKSMEQENVDVCVAEQLKALRPKRSVRDRQRSADSTHPVFDESASYETEPASLPMKCLEFHPERTMLTIHLLCNGQILFHDSIHSNTRKTIDQSGGMCASYNALVAWLLSLVPSNVDRRIDEPDDNASVVFYAPFHVIGLQQMAIEGQMMLNVVVVPVKQFTNKDVQTKSKKSQQKDAFKDHSPFHRVISKYLSQNTLRTACQFWQTLESVEIHSNAKGKGFSYSSPLPCISDHPLSTFIHLNTNSDAVCKIFLAPVGFFWQTIDSEERCCAEHQETLWDTTEGEDGGKSGELGAEEGTQNVLSIVHKKVFREQVSMIGILNRILQAGLCVCGLRLVYPTAELMGTVQTQLGIKDCCDLPDSVIAGQCPILALALRGAQARKVWSDALGPPDPTLARRTDPNSLWARYGGNSRDESFLFSPRHPSRVLSELARWFGGRFPPSGVINVGGETAGGRISSSSSTRKTKKGNKKTSDEREDVESFVPIATLTATTISTVFVVVSSLVPPSCLGFILSLSQERGFSLDGIKRFHLNSKQATLLGITGSDEIAAFTTGSTSSGNQLNTVSPLSTNPSAIFIFSKENARITSTSLIELIMTRLTLLGILENLHLSCPVSSSLLFHVSPYSPALIQSLGGNFSKLPEAGVKMSPKYMFGQLYTNPELEQVVIVAVCGRKCCNSSGLFLANLLGVAPFNIKPMTYTGSLEEQMTSAGSPTSLEPFELLGIKWLPRLTSAMARELTPYEVGGQMWRSSVQQLTSEPALVLAFRGINAFKRLESIVCVPVATTSCGGGMQKPPCGLHYIMSFTPEVTYQLATIFFSESELFSDNSARTLLRYLPASVETTRDESINHRLCRQKDMKTSSNNNDDIFDFMLSGPQPIVSFLLIKPDTVARHTCILLRNIYQQKFTIVAMRLELLTEEVVRELLEVAPDIYYPSVAYICSGPCLLLVLERENCVKKLLDVVGSSDQKESRKQRCYNWRTMFGTDAVANGFYCSVDYKKSILNQKIFFPEGLCCRSTDTLRTEKIICPATDRIIDLNHLKTRQLILSPTTIKTPGSLVSISGLTDLTCALLAPSALKPISRSTKIPSFVEIIDGLLDSRFELVGCRMIWLSQGQAEHFARLQNILSFDTVLSLTSGPSIVLALQKDSAVLSFRNLFDCETSAKLTLNHHKMNIFYPKDFSQACSLLTFFFDKLSPSSQAQIIPVIKTEIVQR